MGIENPFLKRREASEENPFANEAEVEKAKAQEARAARAAERMAKTLEAAKAERLTAATKEQEDEREDLDFTKPEFRKAA